MFARCAGHGAASETPIGLIPPAGADGLDTRGMGISETAIAELLRVDTEEWKAQMPHFHEHFAKFDNLPEELHAQLHALEGRIGGA